MPEHLRVWQQPDWPRFSWDGEHLAPLLRECAKAQGRLLGMSSTVDGDGLSAEQIKLLSRLCDGGERGFEEGISAAQYQAVAKVSKATATRHLSGLFAKNCLTRLPGGGRSTRYQINWPAL